MDEPKPDQAREYAVLAAQLRRLVAAFGANRVRGWLEAMLSDFEAWEREARGAASAPPPEPAATPRDDSA